MRTKKVHMILETDIESIEESYDGIMLIGCNEYGDTTKVDVKAVGLNSSTMLRRGMISLFKNIIEHADNGDKVFTLYNTLVKELSEAVSDVYETKFLDGELAEQEREAMKEPDEGLGMGFDEFIDGFFKAAKEFYKD